MGRRMGSHATMNDGMSNAAPVASSHTTTINEYVLAKRPSQCHNKVGRFQFSL